MLTHAGPVLHAQWRTAWNAAGPGARSGRIGSSLLWCAWYGAWSVGGALACIHVSAAPPAALAISLPWMLLGASMFWQLSPLFTANLGASIAVRKLLIYPIPPRDLLAVELLLRLFTAFEILLVLAGITVGLFRNAAIPHLAIVPALGLLILCNLFLATGVRAVMERLLSRRRMREFVVVIALFCAAIPQLITYNGLPPAVREWFTRRQYGVFPWSAAASSILGDASPLLWLVLLLWAAAAWAFGRAQFGRTLSFDPTAFATHARAAEGSGRTPWPIRLVRTLFRDPLAALIEKELRSLARSPRFRVLFLMGFSFGMIIWWAPLHSNALPAAGHISYPVAVSGYGLLLLAEVVFGNQFAFDRAGAQIYFSVPLPIGSVIRAKNLTAMGLVAAQVTVVTIICAALGVPLAPYLVAETYAVSLLFALYFLAAGNIISVHHPRPIDPEHSWGRSATGRFQMYLLFLFPLLLMPFALAYLAAWVLDSRAVFWAILAFDTLVGIIAYYLATNAAIDAVERRKEQFLAALGQSSGPVVVE